jgi:hypothetical protein
VSPRKKEGLYIKPRKEKGKKNKKRERGERSLKP